MKTVCRFNAAGLAKFEGWLLNKDAGVSPPLMFDSGLADPVAANLQLDETLRFQSRFEFGQYLNDVLGGLPREDVLSSTFDGMWAWISACYFAQLAPRDVRSREHYVPVRRGSAGSLLHRHAARTAFELVARHGPNAKFVLQQPMATHGQLLESLTAKQATARSHIFFAVARRLYCDDAGRIARGATSKPKRGTDRKLGDTTGMGSIRRLPMALARLALTHDVDVMSPESLIPLLPREFKRWAAT